MRFSIVLSLGGLLTAVRAEQFPGAATAAWLHLRKGFRRYCEEAVAIALLDFECWGCDWARRRASNKVRLYPCLRDPASLLSLMRRPSPSETTKSTGVWPQHATTSTTRWSVSVCQCRQAGNRVRDCCLRDHHRWMRHARTHHRPTD